jgi:modulator of FtsH protease HflK
VLGVLVAWFALDSWSRIDESQRGVVLRFGKFDRLMGSGLNFKWPSPIEQVYVVDTTKVRSTSDQVRMLTKDENLVIVDFNVQYTVSNAKDFTFGVRDPEETLRQAAESAVRQVIGGSTMETIISPERTALVDSAKKILQETLNYYNAGLEVTELSFPNLRPPQEVKEAFDDAIAAREDKQRLQNEADAYAKKVVPEARGDAARIRAEAEGDRASAIAKATGDAERFRLIAEQYKLAPEVTRKRLLLETMQQVLSNSRKVLVEGGGDKVLYLSMDPAQSPSSLPPVVAQPTPARTLPNVVPAMEATRGRDNSERSSDRDRSSRERRE